ncbi:MAG TPA: sialidase family protein [Acidimicrobiales bacterium]|nr:sialidase family protein [Acidimicrobiales bacterium]
MAARVRSRKVLVVAAASSAIFSLIIMAGARASTPYDWAANMPGCDINTPAVAHYANQVLLEPQPTDGPVPCGVPTGYPTVEQKLVVTKDNTLLYEPALQGGPILSGDGHTPGWGKQFGFATSTDNGATWQGSNVNVNPETYVEDGQVDNYTYVDPTTGRVFWYMYNTGNLNTTPVPACGNGAGATIAYSSNDGQTWDWAYDFDHDCSENPNLVSAKSTIAGEQLSYPNVVYLCGLTTYPGAGGVGSAGDSCSKSLTGGASWVGAFFDAPANDTNYVPSIPPGYLPATAKPQGYYAGEAKDELDPYQQCDGQSTSGGSDVQPLPNGNLVTVISCNSENFLAESTDEGATWHITSQVPFAQSSTAGVGGNGLRIDSAGNMYLAEVENGTSSLTPALPTSSASSASSEILLSHSTNGGNTWSKPLNMIAPGVTSVGTNWFALGTYSPGQVGDVAIAYYGINPNSPDGKNGYSDGYITQTRDALDANPVFWSAQINPSGHPLLYNATTDGNIGVTVLDFNSSYLSPNGYSAWGSWVQDCGVNIATSPACLARYPHISPGNPDSGYAGRLVWKTSDLKT